MEAEVHDGEEHNEAAGNVRIELHKDGERGDNDDKQLFHEENKPRETNVVQLGSPSEVAHFYWPVEKKTARETSRKLSALSVERIVRPCADQVAEHVVLRDGLVVLRRH